MVPPEVMHTAFPLQTPARLWCLLKYRCPLNHTKQVHSMVKTQNSLIFKMAVHVISLGTVF
jgi:hypothetical protein